MPKRIIDYEALWGSGRLAKCAVKNRFIYLWIFGLADAGGSFEMTSIRVLQHKVGALQPRLSEKVLVAALSDYKKHGLLFQWNERGNTYGHWVGSTKPGRLPPTSTRFRHYNVCPQPPTDLLAEYNSRFESRPESRLESGAKSRAKSWHGLGLGVGMGKGKGKGKGTRRVRPGDATDGLTYFSKTKLPTEPKPKPKYLCPDCKLSWEEIEFINHGCTTERSKAERAQQLVSIVRKQRAQAKS